METYSNSDWMSSLPDELQSIQLHKLAIPGSHNSGAYNLSSELAPDAPGFLKTMSRLPGFGRFKATVRNWCECQRLCLKNQLNSGIRYLDLRISSKRGCEDFYLVHALYGPKVREALEEVKEFLENHKGEIVLLDFNHFYQMDTKKHQSLIDQIKSIFGSKLLNRIKMEDLSLRRLTMNQKQVICIYQHQEGANDELMWPKECIKSPWPNTKSPDVCLSRLTKHMQTAAEISPDIFMVCQGILTPDISYTLSRWRRGSVHKMAQQLRPSLLSWIQGCPSVWSHQPNIVIQDFVEEGGCIPCVLELNTHRIGTKVITTPEMGDSFNSTILCHSGSKSSQCTCNIEMMKE